MQTIYEHGQSVTEYMEDLIGYVVDGHKFKKVWAPQIENIIPKLRVLLKNVEHIDRNIIYTYCLYHDCGKPFCIEYDDNKRRHFPNHEQVSYNKWLEYGGDNYVAALILHDMDIHKMTINELSDVYESITKHQWSILVFSALAEVHSNAEMFGGIESTNFKIKLKKILKNIDYIIKK